MRLMAKPTWTSTQSPTQVSAGVVVVDDAADIDQPPDAADIDGRQHILGIIYSDDAAWNAETHDSRPFVARWRML